MEDYGTREKTIEELEEELKAASENYKRLNDLVKRKKDAEEQKRNQKLEAEKKERMKLIDESLSAVNDEIKQYLNDYGVLRLNKRYYYLNYVFNGTSPFWINF